MQKRGRTVSQRVRVIRDGKTRSRSDRLIVEEPLDVLWTVAGHRNEPLLATMRTPGDDFALTAGLLYGLGLVERRFELDQISFCTGGGVNLLNRVVARLRLPLSEALRRAPAKAHGGSPQSACGLCTFEGLSGREALLQDSARSEPERSPPPSPQDLYRASGLFEEVCPVFEATGASHACLILGPGMELLKAVEDVGRHNAADKALGGLFLESDPAADAARFRLTPGSGLLLSSRLSFELAAKAVRAGADWVAALGAPSDLAIELCRRNGLASFGFLSGQRVNRYS